MARPAALLAWSTGKDSAHALHVLRSAGELDVVALLTTVVEDSDRVGMHRVRWQLAEAQAEAVGLPIIRVNLPWPCPNVEYEARLGRALRHASATGVSHVAFGDLFLEDIRAYRERLLQPLGLAAGFPLWGIDTAALAAQMHGSGLRAILACVDLARLPVAYAGREFDPALVAGLPAGIDPCAENGEFHTFAWDGPVFSHPVEVVVTGVVEEDGFAYSELAPRS